MAEEQAPEGDDREAIRARYERRLAKAQHALERAKVAQAESEVPNAFSEQIAFGEAMIQRYQLALADLDALARGEEPPDREQLSLKDLLADSQRRRKGD